MGTAIEVVDDDLDDLPRLQDEGVGVRTVDSWVFCIFTDAQGCGQARYLLPYVGDVVERGSGDGVSKM